MNNEKLIDAENKNINEVTVCLDMVFLREKDFKGLMNEIKKKILEENDNVNINEWYFLKNEKR